MLMLGTKTAKVDGRELFDGLRRLVGNSEFDPYREKVNEEMLLCETVHGWDTQKCTDANNLLMVPCSLGFANFELARRRRQPSSTFKLVFSNTFAIQYLKRDG
jgi:hypothetical protein